MNLQNLILLTIVALMGPFVQAESEEDVPPSQGEHQTPALATESEEKPTEAAPENEKKSGTVTFSAAVNVIRKMDRTEVVFRNGESYYLPRGSKSHGIFDACVESEKTGQPISVTVHPQSRIIQSVDSAKSDAIKK